MAMILSKIFYGSSYLGFEVMDEIDPLLGPPLMYIFVTLSSILLMGSLTGKSSFSKFLFHPSFSRKGQSNIYIYKPHPFEHI